MDSKYHKENPSLILLSFMMLKLNSKKEMLYIK